MAQHRRRSWLGRLLRKGGMASDHRDTEANNQSASDIRIGHALEAHLAEYSAMRAQIDLCQKHQYQLVNYAILVNGGVITLFSIGNPSLAERQPLVLIAASVLLSLIGLAVVDLGLAVQQIAQYLKDAIAPRVRDLLKDEEAQEQFLVLEWDEYIHRIKPTAIGNLMRGITASAKYIVTFFFSAGLLALYYVLHLPTPWLWYEMLFFTIGVAILLLQPLSGLFNVVSIIGAIRNRYHI